ncbi:MAG: Phosphoribosylformylglycinamidine cyclo-ligase [Elusimicrobia bacterium]|nr:Phosphoribosylformylglycinamidine cyclo-ligase [Elusimicrobiota bacterium]
MITYKKAGVDIDAGNELVRRIKKMAPRIGGFSDGMALPKGYKEPILIGCTDGVGTKLAIAQTLNKHDTIGYDLVGMNVNDLICSGAKPLFFLDYYASGKLDVTQAETVVRGIVAACKESDCVLIGGETAEMPGFYKPGEYDLAGFATGVVEKSKKLRPHETIRVGDVLLGLPSSGFHSNGYSLVRKVFSPSEWKEKANVLLAPTRLYVRPVLRALEKLNTKGQWNVRGIVHVTGGGFTDNVPRILPKNLSAEIRVGSWKTPLIFREVQARAKISDKQMYWTFNNGVGMILALAPSAVERAKKLLPEGLVIGRIVKGNCDVRYV